MRFRKIVLAVLSGVFLCLPSCKIIPAVPEGAEGCPIWSSKPGMIWAGIINGAYPVSGIFNSLKIVPYSSIYPKMSKDRQLIQSAIEELRTIEQHIVRELDTNSNKPREMDKLGGITFDIGEDPNQLQHFYFGFYRENVCILTSRRSDEISIAYYQLDTNADQLVDELVKELGSSWDYMNE